MNDEAALLAAIIAYPDEDTPRLMYADWLDEHGQPERAEFIRLQCHPSADEAAEDRVAELEECNRAKWLAGLPQFADARWEFRRGFPEFLKARGDRILEWYDGFARAQWLRFLSLYSLKNSLVREFVSLPWNPRWIALELRWNLLDFDSDCTPTIIAIASCPQVQQLRWLRLSPPHLASQVMEALAPLRERFGDRLVIE